MTNYKRPMGILLLVIATLLPICGWAGGSAGGGGNVVVFYTDASKTKIDHFELFDYWEQPKLFSQPYTLDLGPTNWSVEKKVNYVIDRLSKYDVYRGYNYRTLANDILVNLNDYFLKDAEFGDPDDDHSPLKPPLKIADKVRGAVNFWGSPKTNKPFLFSQYVYTHPKMTNDVRAGLILHEISYHFEFDIYTGQPPTSDPIRRINYIVSSDAIPNSLSVDDYDKETQALPRGLDAALKVRFKDCPVDIFISTIANSTYLYLDENDSDWHDVNVDKEVGSLASWSHFLKHCNNTQGYWVCNQNLEFGHVLLPADLSSCGQQNLLSHDLIRLGRDGSLLSIKHQ